MNKCSVLDCTLRDGGYINNFNFGEETIKDIVNKLTNANTDIIECGFLKSNAFDNNRTLYGSVEAIKKYISPKKNNVIYVAMIAYGDISIDEINECDLSSIDGIRLTFHQSQIEQAFAMGQKLMDKNYKVFMQPVGTTTYSTKDLMSLVERVNKMNPFAFYLVDTLGAMFSDDLCKMIELVDNSLNKNIRLGFHSHNNLQLSFANAIEMIRLKLNRHIIIDSSVFGMGRGAGNLCTELIMKYINHNVNNRYDVVPVLEIFDEHINKILLEYKWGYSLPYFIASMNNCHPNYATHLINKQTISIKEINYILSSMQEEKRNIFDKQYIEKLYIQFQKHNVDDSKAIEYLQNKLINCDRPILIIAPGKSVKKELDKITDYCDRTNPIVFAVNFVPQVVKTDYIFVSNQKRIKNIKLISEVQDINCKVIATSNILESIADDTITLNYSEYINEESSISDNAGLMLINLLCKLNVKEINLAGFDGFSTNSLDNYCDNDYTNSTEFNSLTEKTVAITQKLRKLKDTIKINFITKSRYNEYE